jgi:hypothetical protein
VSIPLTPTNWTLPVTLQKFDPSLGALDYIAINTTVSQLCSISVESGLSVPAVVTTHIETPVFLIRPDLSFIQGVTAYGEYTDSVSAFDGTVDYAGTSGFVHSGINGQAGIGTSLHSAADFALFTGQAGNPGTITLEAISTGSYSFSAVTTAPAFAANVVAVYNSGAVVNVCYHYTPLVYSYCAGDGSGSACPCGNNGAPGAGCQNSTGTGAVLSALGAPSVGNDTLTLSCGGMPAGTTAFLYQGTTNLGTGVIFGDGLRCVGGAIVRLHSQIAPGGTATWPQVGQAPLSVEGSTSANDLRYYQAWYRNSASYCTPSTFNVSGGLSVKWVP